MKALSRVKEEMNLTRYFTYCFVTIWKMIAFLCCILLILWIQGETVGNFFTLFETGFGEHNILVEEVSLKRYFLKSNPEKKYDLIIV